MKKKAAEKPPKTGASSLRKGSPPAADSDNNSTQARDLVIITGLSGSGKGSALKVFEDMGYYAVDNLPVDLIPTFAELCRHSPEISRAALVVDIREGRALKRFPGVFEELRRKNQTFLLFLEADDEILQRRFSETRRPHPLGVSGTVGENVQQERKALRPIRRIADLTIDTSQFTIHDLRRVVISRFQGSAEEQALLVTLKSFGFKHGVPTDSDLVFDVRFLPNPNYIPECKNLTGRHPKVVEYVRSFPQTGEFIRRISELLVYLIPHYAREGKSYLTISFGCTGGRHRSVMIAESIGNNLTASGHTVKVAHRDLHRKD